MKNLVVFASGNGSNFEATVHAFNSKYTSGQVVGCICDQPFAYVITRAHNLKIPVAVFQRTDFDSKAAMEQAMVHQCQLWQADWIILAGYMRLCSEILLQAYPRHILNIHPSLLPKYRGKDALQQAFDAQELIVGVSVHYVDEGMDTGEIIMQIPLEVKNRCLKEVEERIHRLEHQLYPAVIHKLLLEEQT